MIVVSRRHWFALVSLTLAILSASVAHSAGPRIRILTYNIHHGEGTDRKFDLPRLAKIIRNAQPDLVALQEVDRKTRRASGVDQAAELGRLTEMHAEFGKAMDYSGGEYGDAVLSRVKPLAATVHALPHDNAETEPRAALAVRVQLRDDLPELVFLSTHLCHQKEANRVAQAKEINRLYPLAVGPPAILAGDLNARSGSDSHREFARQWVDTLPKVRTIDYVLPRKGDPWQVVETKVLDEPVASDHNPVLVVLEWTGKLH